MDPTADVELALRHCSACGGHTLPLSAEAARPLLAKVEGWQLAPGAERIRRHWKARNFMAAIEFFNRVAALAEQEGHHPDLHLEGYRNVTVEIWTHSIGGLSDNDFILAAKINQIPLAVRA
jgi:4a-hydroxytetrahydrobiopterin dehydratase